MDKGSNLITFLGRGSTSEQLASYSQEEWDRSRQHINMDVDRRSRMDHHRNMTFDYRPADLEPYIRGLISTGQGLYRCIDHCGSGIQMLTDVAVDGDARSFALNKLAEFALENPGYVTGRITLGGVSGVIVGGVTKSSIVGVGTSAAVNFSATSGDVGYYTDLARSLGLNLTNQQIINIIQYGDINLR